MSQHIRPRAVLDIDELAAHLEQRLAGLGARFLVELETTLGRLEAMPGLGGPYPLSHPALAGLRAFPSGSSPPTSSSTSP